MQSTKTSSNNTWILAQDGNGTASCSHGIHPAVILLSHSEPIVSSGSASKAGGYVVCYINPAGWRPRHTLPMPEHPGSGK